MVQFNDRLAEVDALQRQCFGRLTAMGGLPDGKEASLLLATAFRDSGFDFADYNVFSLLVYSAGMSKPDLVFLCGPMAVPLHCRHLRDRGYKGYILVVLKNPIAPAHEYFDAGADDVTINDSPIELSLRLLAAKKAIFRAQSTPNPYPELQDRSDRLQSILDTHLDYMSRFLSDGSLSFVNDAICHNYAMKREELLGLSIVDFVPLEERALLTEKIATCFRDAKPFISRQKAVDHLGRVQWTEWYNIPVLNSAGKVAKASVETSLKAFYYQRG